MSVPSGVAMSTTLTARAKAAYMALAGLGWGGATTAQVAEAMGCSWLTAQRALDDLRAAGWITEGNERAVKP